MKKYDNYKDSGIEWIGEIPSHWEVKKLKYLAFIGNGKDHKGVWDENGIYPIIGTGGKFGNSNAFLYDKPSVILGRKGTIDNPQFIESPFWAVDTVYYTIIREDTVPKYLFYLSTTINFNLYKYGSAVPSMNQEVLKEIYFAVPEKSEQSAIASYLDRKTTEIDELIADKKRLLELYEEEKTAIINQAVTKGLNHDYEGLSDDPDFENQTEIKPSGKSKKSRFRPMKESGIEWLGEIPEHWEVKRLKYVVSLNDETLSEKTDEEMHIDYIEIGGLKNGNIGSTEYRFGNAPSRARRIVRNGDVIVSTVRTYLKAIAQISDDKDGYIASTGFAILRPKKIDSKFLGYYSYSPFFIDNTIANSVGVTYPAINASNILEFPIQIPPIEEQKAIVHHIEIECTRIDAKINNTKKLIGLLTEYRTALISEVVTGKIKVTD